MSVRHYFKIAMQGVTANKGRAALTVLGIVIGIAAIMLMMSLGRGAENLILGEIGGSETYRADVFGTSAEFFSELFNVYPEVGDLFTDADIRARAALAVIGYDVAEELFGSDTGALGELISIKGKKFRVAGVYPDKGQVAFINFNRSVILPYTTARDYLLGINYYHEIMTRASSPEAIARTVVDIETTLREAHGITDPEKDDFFVVTQEALVAQIKTIIGTLTVFLSSVVAIALVVGGIGIMNIMLVSVTERTKEIGLRKALGATEKNILLQFLIEAVFLTAAGGVIGIALGSALSFLVAWVLRVVMEVDWSFAFPLSGAILAFSISAAVGLIFGIYPARKAAKKSPIEALRYE